MQIKFRAWQKHHERMLEVVRIDFETEKLTADYGENTAPRFNTFEIENFELMQFTGLHDKNGNPIYEGDILSTDLSRPYLVVEFRNGCFMCQCHDSGKDYYDIMLPIDANSDQDKFAEVIGNIYENPELLKEEVK